MSMIVSGDHLELRDSVPDNLFLSEYGPQGVPGPPGPAGGQTFIYQQVGVAQAWTINHNLGRFPAVIVVDAAGNVIEPDVQYLNNNAVQVYFSVPTSGSAYIN